MSTIDLSGIPIDRRVALAAAITQLVTHQPPNPCSSAGASVPSDSTPRDVALTILQRILNQATADTKEAIALLSKLLPNSAQLDVAPDSAQLLNMLANGNDESILLRLLKTAAPQSQPPQPQDIEILRQRLECLIKTELNDELTGQLLELLHPLEAEQANPTKLDLLVKLIDPRRATSLDEKGQLFKLLQQTDRSADSKNASLPAQTKEIADALELVRQITAPQVKQLSTTIVARALQQNLAELMLPDASASEAQLSSLDSGLSRVLTNPEQSKEAHNLKPRAALVEFLFPNHSAGETDEMAQGFKLLLSASPGQFTKPLQIALNSLVNSIAAPLIDLIKLVQTVEQELASQASKLPSSITKALRQQLHLVLEHTIARDVFEDPQALLLELRTMERHPDRFSPARTSQAAALAERLLNEVDREHKQPLPRLFEKVQRGRSRVDEQATPDQKDKSALLAAVDRLMRGQELIRQLNPVLQALGEPSVFFFPSFLSGLFAQLEVLAYPSVDPEEEARRGKKSKNNAFKTIEFSTSFNRLGDTAVKIQYGQQRIYISLDFARSEIVPFVQARIARLEESMRALGYVEVGLSARASEVKKVGVRSKVVKGITA